MSFFISCESTLVNIRLLSTVRQFDGSKEPTTAAVLPPPPSPFPLHLFCVVAMPPCRGFGLQGLGGIGAFFRVGFWGALPAELKGLEFVYRVPLMTHVSDFQNRVLKLIHPLVSDPAKVGLG